MAHLTLTAEQLNLLAQANEPIAVHDDKGVIHGYIALLIAAEELALAKQAMTSTGPRYTTAQVLDKLRARGAG
jgi:hypothetical protein